MGRMESSPIYPKQPGVPLTTAQLDPKKVILHRAAQSQQIASLLFAAFRSRIMSTFPAGKVPGHKVLGSNGERINGLVSYFTYL